MRYSLLFLCCAFNLFCIAQTLSPEFPFKSDPAFFKDYQEALIQDYKDYVEGLKEDRNFKELEEEYEDQVSYTIDDIQDSLFFSNEKVQNYLESILNEIVESNPNTLQKGDYFILVSKETFPNAYTPGDGTIVIQADLFRRFKSESELAFVIAHEIGHNYFNHVKSNIEKSVAFYNSKETKKEITSIRYSTYGKAKKLDAFLKKYSFDRRKHSRIGESACDSLAVTLLSNTSFNPHAAISVLNTFDSVDDSLFNHEINFRDFFELNNYSAKESYVDDEFKASFSLSGLGEIKKTAEQEALADSLKTHPDCTERIAFLGPILSSVKAGKDNPINEAYFKAIKQQLEFESIESEFYFKRLDLALYRSLQLLVDFPEEPYLYVAVAKSLIDICDYQKKHQYGLVVRTSRPHFPKDFNDFLGFLGEQNIQEMGAIALAFIEHHKNKIQHESAYAELLEEATSFAEKVEENKETEFIKHEKY